MTRDFTALLSLLINYGRRIKMSERKSQNFSGQAIVGFCPLCEITYIKESLDESGRHMCPEGTLEQEDEVA